MNTATPSVPQLSNRRILLGVTGGIAAYKAADLVRRLKESGADVQVVMTAGAREFVTPLTFQALSGREVRTSLLDPRSEDHTSELQSLMRSSYAGFCFTKKNASN